MNDEENEQSNQTINEPDAQGQNQGFPVANSPAQNDQANASGSAAGLFESEKKLRNKLLLKAFVCVVIFVGILFYILGGSEKEEAPVETTAQESIEPTEEASSSQMLSDVIYLSSSDSTNEKMMYSRPASGGEAKDLGHSLPADIHSKVSRSGNKYVIATNNEVFIGEGSNEPTSIYTDQGAGDRINSAVISPDGNSVAVSLSAVVEVGNTVGSEIITMDFDGSDQTSFYSIDSTESLVVSAWDSSKDIVYFRKNCTACSGFNADLYKTTESGSPELVKDFGGFSNALGPSVYNDNLTRLVYIEGTVYSDEQIAKHGINDDFGTPAGAPYTLKTLDLDSGTVTTLVESFGSIKDFANQSYKNIGINWMGQSNDEGIAYSYGETVYAVNPDGTQSKLFESGQGDVSEINFASNDEVLVTISETPNSSSSYFINYFNVESQEVEKVMANDYPDTVVLLVQSN